MELNKELNPSRDDFAALLLRESLAKDDLFEGTRRQGQDRRHREDLAVIDVGLKMEGRVPLKEFGVGGKPGDLKIRRHRGSLPRARRERVGEAVLSRDKARREESWTRLEKLHEKGEKVTA